MIALDTNVLVRFTVHDASAVEQSLAAQRLVLGAAGVAEPILLTNVVLCEFVWVLRRAYELDRATVARALQQLLATEHLVFESADAVMKAATDYAKGPADFADYLLRHIALSTGCDRVYTFDRKFAGAGRVELLGDDR